MAAEYSSGDCEDAFAFVMLFLPGAGSGHVAPLVFGIRRPFDRAVNLIDHIQLPVAKTFKEGEEY